MVTGFNTLTIAVIGCLVVFFLVLKLGGQCKATLYGEIKNDFFLSLSKVTSSECSRDEALISYEGALENEEACIALCQTYSSVPTLGCTFASWESLGPFGNCILYKSPETFASYISHCNKLSGPKNVSGCSVETPEDSTCDVIRYFQLASK